MNIILILFIFLIGISIGSFLNVLIDRIPRGKSIIWNNSHCPSCGKNLKWLDLIPLLSFVLLQGKCRYCHVPISYYYPITELVTGILFVLAFLFLPGIRSMHHILSITYISSIAYYLFVGSSLIIVLFTDLKYGIIPDKVVYPAIGISLLYTPLNTKYLLLNSLLSALLAFGFFLLLYLITREHGMGLGDVKLAFLLGLFLGFPKIIVALYLAFLTGAIVGIILILWKKKKLRKTVIPFGPFLVGATFVTVFFGDLILQRAIDILHFT